MVNPAFHRAVNSVLAKLGGSAVLLRGEVVDPPRVAHVAQDVEIIDGNTGHINVVSHVATLQTLDNPAKGDSLSVDGENFILEAPVDTNGASTRFIARLLPPDVDV